MGLQSAPREIAYKFLDGFNINSRAEYVHRLSEFTKADVKPGVYEIGLKENGLFKAHYIGKARKQMLRTRLSQHARKSSNRCIEARKKAKDVLYFRCTPVPLSTHTLAAINVIEGMYLAAFREQYDWNLRQEWSQHFAVEDI